MQRPVRSAAAGVVIPAEGEYPGPRAMASPVVRACSARREVPPAASWRDQLTTRKRGPALGSGYFAARNSGMTVRGVAFLLVIPEFAEGEYPGPRAMVSPAVRACGAGREMPPAASRRDRLTTRKRGSAHGCQ